MIALHGGFISIEETIEIPLVGLGVDLKDRTTSGENEILPKNLEADVRSRDRTYGPLYHSGHTIQSVTGDFIFTIHPIALIFRIL
jgi:hypothetical protein